MGLLFFITVWIYCLNANEWKSDSRLAWTESVGLTFTKPGECTNHKPEVSIASVVQTVPLVGIGASVAGYRHILCRAKRGAAGRCCGWVFTKHAEGWHAIYF